MNLVFAHADGFPAARRPDLAASVVLLDSPVLSGWKARAVQFGKAAGIGERLSPGHVSKKRPPLSLREAG